VNATESVEITGRDTINQGNSNLTSFTGSAEQAGNLTINTRRLSVRDGGLVSTESIPTVEGEQPIFPGSGGSGNLTINAADSVEVLRGGLILTNTDSPGNAGNLTINTDRLLVEDKSRIGANSLQSGSLQSGDAGNITVQARSIILRNQSEITALTESTEGGNIRLQIPDLLLLRGNSTISTTAGENQIGGNGGNIIIDGNLIVAIASENSDIRANAITGRGGSVAINAQSIFGIQARSEPTTQSDITASSESGIDGVVSINTPDVDPSQGLVELPGEVTDASRLIAQNCPTGGDITNQNEFFITGRGGLPPTPREAVDQDAIQVDLVTVNLANDLVSVNAEEDASDSQPVSQQNPPALPSESPIVEAQGWQIAADGRVVLVAAVPQSATNFATSERIASSPNHLADCR
jgi:large exoprotein involved in heme utilization and adhesion